MLTGHCRHKTRLNECSQCRGWFCVECNGLELTEKLRLCKGCAIEKLNRERTTNGKPDEPNKRGCG